ncbi:MAG: AbrB/MazE/SpoVT family DNA-binding domain-containing protein [bacterium]|nr:AbrB/MazE/SpoVT family DNA-binding domain-containing protein [bacterium]
MVGIQLLSKVGERGQVVIPKPLREKLKIIPNSIVIFELEENKVTLKKSSEGLNILEEYVNGLKKKIKLPKNINWDEMYYSQFKK